MISQARSAGLVVIVATQWEPGSQEVCSVQTPTCTPPGWSNQDNIPFAGNTANNQSSTFRAWQVLAPLFANDNGVIYEALNEPGSSASDSTWPLAWGQWQTTEQDVIPTPTRVRMSRC